MPRRLLVLLILALSIRLAWAFVQPANDAAIDALPDQREYLSLGRNLLHQHRLEFFDPRFHQTIYAYRMPGYPMLVAACGGSVWAVRVVQCLIDVSTVLAVYGIARRVGLGTVSAEVAAAIAAVNPFLIYFSGALLTETCFTSAVTWAVYFLIAQDSVGVGPAVSDLSRFVSSRGPQGMRGVGRFSDPGFAEATHAAHTPATASVRVTLLVAAAAIFGILLRPTAIVLFPLLSFGLRKSRRQQFTLVAASIFVIVFGWGIRNQLLIGHPAFTTTNGGVTLYDGFNPSATGASDQRFFDQMPVEKSMTEYDRSQSLGRQAREWAIQHPWQVVLLSGRKIVRGWSPVPLSQDFGKTGYRVLAGSFAVPFDLAVLGGLFFGRFGRSRKWLLLLPAIGVTVAQVLSVGSLRYRIPAEPVLAVLAAAGLATGGKEMTVARRL